MIQVRAAAVQEIQRLVGRPAGANTEPQAYLTLAPSSCGDWTYQLSAIAPASAPTTVIDCDGIRLAVSTEHLELLKDLTIDYAEDLMGGGFRFTNPQARRTCGCGNAFALSADTPVTEDCMMQSTPGPGMP
jgi:iron-sulfur cluster assembly accessory protein